MSRKIFLSIVLWPMIACIASGLNQTSAVFTPALLGEQQAVFGTTEHAITEVDQETYLRRSIKSELQKRLSAKAIISLRGESDFSALNARYTDYKRPQYIAVVRVAKEQDVIEVINYARARNIQFIARTGGHSLTTSLRRVKNAIAIDMRELNAIEFDAEKRQMKVGGGISTGEFANATHTHGMEVTHAGDASGDGADVEIEADIFEAVGSCPCTGVLGISLGAGIGRLQGKYGYLNDNMVSVRMALANGSVVTASQEENRPLFWAVRGAGHNFGIALEATYRVHPQVNGGEHLVVDFEFGLEKLERVFEAVNAVSDPMPEEVAIFVIGRRKGANGQPTININLVYSGPEHEATAFVRTFDAISPVWKDAKVVAWDALPWATYNGLNNILCTPEGWSRFPIKNFYGANAARYDVPTMRAFFDGWREMNERYSTGEAMFSVMFESFAQQRVRDTPDDATAYPWRHGSQHFLMIEAAHKGTVDGDVLDRWLSEQQDRFIETSGYGRLQQYVNYGHGSKDPPEALYGYDPWRLEKLRRLKADIDPEGWFNGYQPFAEETNLDDTR